MVVNASHTALISCCRDFLHLSQISQTLLKFFLLFFYYYVLESMYWTHTLCFFHTLSFTSIHFLTFSPAELIMRLWNVLVSYRSGSNTTECIGSVCVNACNACVFCNLRFITLIITWRDLFWQQTAGLYSTHKLFLCVFMCMSYWSLQRLNRICIVANTKAVRSLIETFCGQINDFSLYLLFLFSLSLPDTAQCTT